MQDHKGKKVGKKGALKVVARGEEEALRAYFSEGGQHLLPLLELVRDAKASVDELMMGAAIHRTVAGHLGAGSGRGEASGPQGW